MGTVHSKVRLASLGSRDLAEDLELLVDTGATFTVVSSDVWTRLGLTAEFRRRLRTADGRVLERGQGDTYLEIDGRAGVVPVVEGGNGDLPGLGVTTLEILGLAVDPISQVLVPTEHLYS